jgi:2,4-dienoyl-CoA reductase-like NADH-dependent reductase (Old Yellow Enzyme family)
MERMFNGLTFGHLELLNRFVFPPIKIGAGNPDGHVTDRQLIFYRQIARSGPAIVILEPVDGEKREAYQGAGRGIG